jgi:hypothetical protein
VLAPTFLLTVALSEAREPNNDPGAAPAAGRLLAPCTLHLAPDALRCLRVASSEAHEPNMVQGVATLKAESRSSSAAHEPNMVQGEALLKPFLGGRRKAPCELCAICLISNQLNFIHILKFLLTSIG